MGNNTVVLVLNDHMHEIVKSPRTLAWAICHPPSSLHDLEKHWWPQVISIAKGYEEDIRPLLSGLKVLPTFHADDKHVLIAGWNSLTRPALEDFKMNRDRTKITVNLPEWWRR